MSLFKLLTMPEKNLMTQKQLHGKQKEKSGLIIISAVLNRHLDVNKKKRHTNAVDRFICLLLSVTLKGC